MTLRTTIHRTLAVALITSTCLLALAPLAEAGRGSKRYKHRARAYPSYTRVVVRESSAAPLVAGLVGGFLLGTAVSNAQAAPVVVHEHRYDAPRYRYFDPYCDRWFSELSSFREHGWNDRHPVVVRVYDSRGGDCVRTMRWRDGAWYDTDDRDWDRHRDHGDCDDRGWRD